MNNIHIYADSPVSEYHLTMLRIPEIKIYKNLEEFKLIPTTETKHAVFHACFPYEPEDETAFDNIIFSLLGQCVSISVLIPEVHTPIVNFMNRFQYPQIIYFICGFVEGIETYPWISWFNTTSSFYRRNPQVLNELTPYSEKPKYFDILLGQPKPHRDRVYNYITNNRLEDRVTMTYLTNHLNKSIQAHGDSGFIMDELGLEVPEHNINWTVSEIIYRGSKMSLSQVVPINIYNQTAYTIITETNIENHYTFFTEKTCKPIMAERLFIMLGGQHYLRNLRALGFKTFDGIIDESYDTEIDNNQRWSMAIEQMKYLLKQPQSEILSQIKPITEHNKQIMLTTNWEGVLRESMKKFITGTN